MKSKNQLPLTCKCAMLCIILYGIVLFTDRLAQQEHENYCTVLVQRMDTSVVVRSWAHTGAHNAITNLHMASNAALAYCCNSAQNGPSWKVHTQCMHVCLGMNCGVQLSPGQMSRYALSTVSCSPSQTSCGIGNSEVLGSTSVGRKNSCNGSQWCHARL